MSFVRLSAFILIGFAAVMSSCGGGETASTGFYDSPSEDDGNVVSTAGFYVKAAAADWPMTTLMHRFYQRAQPCVVLQNATGLANIDIKCMYNVREADLYYSDIKYELNVPPGMCTYIRERPSRFWNAQPGRGPVKVEATLDASTPPAVTACASTAYTGGPSVPGAVSAGKCVMSEAVVDGTGTFTCIYNHTEAGLGNCCMGKYTSVVTPAVGDPTTTNSDWGGKYGNCVLGSVVDTTWPLSPVTSVPQDVVTPALASGFNKTYTMPKSIGRVQFDSNLRVANFYGWLQYAAGNHDLATVPVPLGYDTDVSGTVLSGGSSAANSYECLDESDEVIARIRVYVNEWDTNEQFLAYLGGSLTASPHVSGADGTGCKTEGVPGSLCNDFEDWDTFTSDPSYATEKYPKWEDIP